MEEITKPETTIELTITLSRTYRVSDSASALARLMGVNMGTLRAIVDDGADWEPEEATLSKLADLGDIEDEDWSWEEIIASEIVINGLEINTAS